MTDKKDIHLFTASTMNGWKPVISLKKLVFLMILPILILPKKPKKRPIM